MSPRFQSPPSMVVPTALAIIGVAYCLFVYLGVGESVCITAGCSLYKSFNIAGISMWIFGIIAFVCLALLMAAGAYAVSLCMARLFLVADCFLMLVMASTSPCLSCLGVALLFAIIYFALRHAKSSSDKGSSRLLLVWSLLFVSNLVLSAREMLPPEPIYGPREAPVHIYFSPSCTHCLEAMEAYNLPDGQVAYFATDHTEEDLAVLAALNQKLKSGYRMPGALKEVLANSSNLPGFSWNWENIRLRWQLWRNKATVFERNGGLVPYITFTGMASGPSSGGVVRGESLLGESVSVPAAPARKPDTPVQGSGAGAVAPAVSAPAVPAPTDTGLFDNATTFSTCPDGTAGECD